MSTHKLFNHLGIYHLELFLISCTLGTSHLTLQPRQHSDCSQSFCSYSSSCTAQKLLRLFSTDRTGTHSVAYLQIGTLLEAWQRHPILAGGSEGKAEVLWMIPNRELHFRPDVLGGGGANKLSHRLSCHSPV